MKNILPYAFVLVFLFSCADDPKKPENIKPVLVTVSKVTSGNTAAFITASGKIESENSAEISTRMMGYVHKIHVKTGQQVKKGQLLVSINNADLQAKKAQAEAGVLQATASYNNAKKDYDRFVNLFQQQSASQKELDDKTARFEMAKAGLESAKQMKNEVVAQFTYANITAPFSGVITQTFVKDGDMATPGMPLISMEGMSKMQVAAMVSEEDISNIKKGMNAAVLIKSLNKEMTGKVSEVSQSAKNTGGQYLVKISLDKMDAEIRSGMFVNVQFPLTHQTDNKQTIKILVPENALVRQGQLTGIYTVGNDNTAILRWLRVGNVYGNQMEVLSGLSVGETYIISSEGKLYNGVKIRIQ
ncbi:MAG: efflux RND transporter periplasmic adaptor subunit [Bacteroidetes bacterium HGW-Bacteroidetes-13]|nr:MAG: efflux RND transporter periplasmic adaptor subunit [Bacteroidetes bacterium HGW-Bacteroidetes-13]